MARIEREFVANSALPSYESYDDELGDEFEPLEYHEVRHLVEDALKRGEHHRAARIIRAVREARVERSIRRKMLSSLEKAGGSLGIERLMTTVCESEGESAMNATLCLVYIMQDEGKLTIAAHEDREEILVEIVQRRHKA
ncbi:hypothetical protein KC953_00370 [Candidatus Saccharibacteria bacterium]|nr:hypothetical protein [Candidatus Saccharibacteria bacterium]